MQRLLWRKFLLRAFRAWGRCRTDSQAVGLGLYISRRWRLQQELKLSVAGVNCDFLTTALAEFQLEAITGSANSDSGRGDRRGGNGSVLASATAKATAR
jgi:hypothetical protein